MFPTGEAAEQSDSGDSGIDGFEQHDGKESKGDPDYKKMFQSRDQELSRTKEELKGYGSKLEDVTRKFEESSSFLERIKQAVSPSESAEPDPTVGWQKEIDKIVKTALEHERAGRPIPLTAQTAITLYEDKIRHYKESKEHKELIKKLQTQVDGLADPEAEVDRQAAAHINSTVAQYLERLYGNSADTITTRSAQYDAITRQIRVEAQKLAKEFPEQWEMLRRDRVRQENLVKFVVEKNQPPKVRQILEQEKLQNSPITTEDLWTNLRRARELKDPKDRDRAVSAIRQEILSRSFGGEKKQGGRGVNQLYR